MGKCFSTAIKLGMLVTCLLALPAAASDLPSKSFRFAVYTTNTAAPFFYHDDQGKLVGIIPDILSEVASAMGVELEYVVTNRKRAEMSLYSGSIDGILLSSEWAQRPGQVLFSKSFFTVEEYVYSYTPFYPGDAVEDWIKDKSVCLRQDYVYPALATFIENERFTPVYLSDFPVMFEMLSSGRCQLAYMAEHKASWLLNRYQPSAKLYRSPEALDAVGSTIAVGKQWQGFLTAFNQHIQDRNSSDKMQDIIDNSYQ